jgi:hypothetical protein
VINQLNHQWSQSTPILKGEGILAMYGLNGQRSKEGRSADVGIKLSLLGFQRKAARELKQTSHNRNIGIRARSGDCNVSNQVLMRGRKIQQNNIPMAITI